ncbi:MAG: hypothetical protein IPN68_10435 [Bacteroidetes bacterium]|nr:hypothetical protein [Bacteroidota bacterium]
MDYRFLLTGIKNILINPSKYWFTINSENISVKAVRNSILLPLTLLVSVAVFSGSLIFINTELSFIYSIFLGIKKFIVILTTTYIAAIILRETTYPLDLGRSFTVSFRLIVFSLVPLLLCQIISSTFESLLFINITGLYGLYIFWAGAEVILKPQHHKRIPLLVATTVVFTGIYLAIDIFLSMLTDRIFYSFFA